MKAQIFCIAAALGLVSASAFSAELVVTAVPTGNNMAVAFDLVSEGNVAGLNFKLNVPGLAESKAKLPKCVADLPSGFSGGCSVTKEGVYVYATSDNLGITIPAGVASIGSVVIANPAARAKAGSAPKLTVSELAVYDNDAKAVTVNSRVDSGTLSRK